MKNFDPQSLMSQAKRMKDELARVQKDLKDRMVEGVAAGGLVSVIANGIQEIQAVRIKPEAVDPKDVEAELKRVAGSGVEVAVSDPGVPTPASPLRADVVRAYTDAVRKRHPGVAIIPSMSTGATDGLYFRAAGIPVYGVDGSWGVSPDDERAHGRDERLPVKALYDYVDHWVDMVKTLAGK